ncbi:MAG: SUMF1/EgtB/PvdO family nonheme iron enzyme [Bacteroidales bacterium]|jgi:formylglycine-generating enzyme required for sulfatase activity|nr:SUMF1/EgtB/PvdO family nonheme iron enzyme [Bacteroidales bacterium]
MKTKIFKIFTVTVLLITVVASCKKEPVDGVIIDQLLLMGVGETVKLTLTFIPKNATNKKVSWKSGDPNVATVDKNGNVTGKSDGQTVIKVITEDSWRTAQCTVIVIQPIEPEEMIEVEGGTFMMGCNDDECMDDELPKHEVTLNGFYISKYVVTQKEWKSTMRNVSAWYDHDKGDDKPVSLVGWNEVQEYIRILNAITSKSYRLPTEAEWEYAARGGNKSHGYKYSGSNNIDEVAWYQTGYYSLQPVGQKKPNELGIYDMSGNVWEWCSNYWEDYSDEPQTNPTGPNTGVYRVVRGGAYYTISSGCRNACRAQVDPNTAGCGFRLVLDKE